MNTPAVKRTPLHAWHLAHGAKMAPFAGFDMPIQYSGIRQEHEAVRARAGLFDVSHMGNFTVRGPGAASYLQRMTINDVSRLGPGDVQYSALCRDDGGVIDDILVYCVAAGDYMVVVNAANIAKDWSWCADHHKKWEADCEMENASESLAILSLQGPAAEAILREVAPGYDGAMKTYGCARLHVETAQGEIAMLVGRTGYTGEDGFEFYPASDEAQAVWDALMEAGAKVVPGGILPIGLAARDTLRLESGYSLYGHELDETVNPLDAGLGWITALEAEGKDDFIGRDALLRVRDAGPSLKTTGILLEELAIPREGCSVLLNGRVVGKVTSGTLSPTLGKGIALARVEPQAASTGTALEVEIRGARKAAKAVARAFYKRPKAAPTAPASGGIA